MALSSGSCHEERVQIDTKEAGTQGTLMGVRLSCQRQKHITSATANLSIMRSHASHFQGLCKASNGTFLSQQYTFKRLFTFMISATNFLTVFFRSEQGYLVHNYIYVYCICCCRSKCFHCKPESNEHCRLPGLIACSLCHGTMTACHFFSQNTNTPLHPLSQWARWMLRLQ